MNHSTTDTEKGLAWILASSNEIIEDSIYYCEMFAHTLAAHHNQEAAKVFTSAQTYFEQEQSIILDQLQGIELPEIPPWELPHPGYEHPADQLQNADYLMTIAEAWELVHKTSEVHSCFYQSLLQETNCDDVKQLLNSLLKLTNNCQQIAEQQRQKNNQPRPIDLDPPNIQE